MFGRFMNFCNGSDMFVVQFKEEKDCFVDEFKVERLGFVICRLKGRVFRDRVSDVFEDLLEVILIFLY